MMNRLFKRKDRLAEAILNMSDTVYDSLWEYNRRDDKALINVFWEKVKQWNLDNPKVLTIKEKQLKGFDEFEDMINKLY